MEYQYPIDYTWSTDEIVDVIHFYECIEKAHEKGIDRDTLLQAYRRFKEIVPGKAEEKTLFNEFEEVSGYVSYQAVKEIKQTGTGEKIKVAPKKAKR
ncbi:UPF0223 family protein [Mesobacillus sp. AQ2]|jgi:uncharacterized protein YktA (UPF0223 family)|uniref:UPF0223 family protein n=1 Tax=unclassified Mesobacillus TaxID=2675270 RepID=UPI002040A005|nr:MULTISPECIES: UPF0223 family protein [unclassified Mesobacillus]MCM3123466.1 UPF0223 family protein [Mesobacillus sp. MER 33]MCM3233051.1 UPF0223 family protein [Mesobacillus sp. MER 48]WHX42125.1 UPF0223 family protein [Mesobacillus sp. AQ2]